jgi:mannose-6-phosphate isomerase
MSELYPLLMVPHFDKRVWGTRDLSPIYSRVVGKDPIGEVWLTGDECKVANGPLSGTTLDELCKRFGRELVGDTAPLADRFPLLVKFLFPNEKLSVQVHPDDEAAEAMGLPNGKTECWYVARAVAGAQVGLGLRPGTTREQFAAAIKETRAEQLMNWVDLKTGDMIYVDAGTVHTIAPGSILIETQQNSDTTFRLYDYGRPRELHIEQGMRAMREHTGAGKVVPGVSRNGDVVLIATSRFIVERHEIAAAPKPFTQERKGSCAQILVAVEGSGVVESAGAQLVAFNRGEAIIIPASVPQFTIRPQWSVEVLRMRVPAEKQPPPKTTLV